MAFQESSHLHYILFTAQMVMDANGLHSNFKHAFFNKQKNLLYFVSMVLGVQYYAELLISKPAFFSGLRFL